MIKILYCLVILFICNHAYPQSDTSGYFSKKIKIKAGEDYERSGLTEVFLGKHWRDLWTTPFEVGVLDLNKFAGGLTPYKRGGGLQTKSLRFQGKDGKKYKFRSIDKDPRKILHPDLQESFFADAFKDQISTSHPFAAVIVSPLLNAVGILNAEPIVVVLPNDSKLGEYQKDFGNVLGTFEENPDDVAEGEKGFGMADKVINSFKLYKKLEKDCKNQVDNVEFLKARLIDLMIGDWDRHSDQWLWAGYEKEGKTIYKPIPRDRDQAFCLYDGLLPMIVGESITQIEGYDEDYPKIYDLSFNARYVDRRFLPGIDKKVYDSLTAFIKSKITNEVITNAVKKMPPEWYKLEGKNLIKMIKARRDNLKEASDEFYELVNEVADVYGSNKDEIIQINTLTDDIVEVSLFMQNKDTGFRDSVPVYQKRFNSDVTDEIRIYTNGGNDKILVDNYPIPLDMSYESPDCDIDIKIIKGKGKKEIRDRHDEILDVYNDERPVNNEVERYEPVNEDRGYDWRFGPGFGYNSDDGVILGGGPILYKYGYNTKPYVYRMSLIGSYAFNAKSYSIKYLGDFYSIIKGVHINLDIQKTELAITRYFGEGNETVLNDSLEAIDYYKVGQELLYISPTFEIPVTKKTLFSIAPFYKYSDVSYDQNTLLGENPATYGIGSLYFLGINSAFTYDTRDNASEPLKGIYARLLGNYTPNIFANNYGYGKAGADLRGYISTDSLRGVTFAARLAGGNVWGDFPFFESMFLGGENSLKGFSRERFAGNGVILGEGEMRFRLAKVNLIIPGIFGISLFGGLGRVYLEGEESKRWHSSFGGTLWMSYLNRMFNVGFTVAKSDEGFKFFFGQALFL